MWSKIGLIIDKKIQTDLKNFYPTHYIVQVPLSIYKFILIQQAIQVVKTTLLQTYSKENSIIKLISIQTKWLNTWTHIGLEFGQPPSFLLYENP